ncbi:phage protein Gp111 [Scopulibacillus darangshiensis]|uniref:Phage protein Gp111 n=1 Tax=Scopulibacillus darangshiensis TaxID=442528 RepID=A0A4R2PAT9_9BACL|nr:hypothetical protein [Scopulibacillus darangshiensis]TCP32200.1 phage protein Gp111 [Scopulibacillus darangshiensis]
MKKSVMAIAWKMARHGAKKFGGKVKDYFSEALKLAWKAVKGGFVKMTAKLETKSGSRKHKTWVAKLTGKNSTYKYERSFVNDFEEDGFSGRIYTLDDGVYDVCDGGDRKYIKVTNGEIAKISETDIAVAL